METTEYVIPINPAMYRDAIVPWKKGYAEVLALGINNRMHREAAEKIWQAERRIGTQEMEGVADAVDREKLVALQQRYNPRRQTWWQSALEALRTHHGEEMCYSIGDTHCRSMAQLQEERPDVSFALNFLCSELKEKSWPSSGVRVDAETGKKYLLCDLRL